VQHLLSGKQIEHCIEIKHFSKAKNIRVQVNPAQRISPGGGSGRDATLPVIRMDRPGFVEIKVSTKPFLLF
jgi:hypothetical protein